ncbi:penicillin-binding protein [Thiosulfatimonas sediminis]|uniref:Penicillin-binding protein 1A n=1 Tax=Thiosulfatimonas sediminis TaxID=2675054 RepID=A0A6F8PYD2_9GAMM|nr:PBP1A family penicillin-binding protein [Thiosulfatimonas sediminis]BBP47004.1 penicillin-binding protein [Thiosulfatimonas sediminis]
MSNDKPNLNDNDMPSMGSAKEIMGEKPTATTTRKRTPAKKTATKPAVAKKPAARRGRPAKKPQKPSLLKRLFKYFFWFNFASFFIALPLTAAGIYYLTIYPTLPEVSELKEVSYQVPLRIVTQDNKLITEIGTKKRVPLEYHEIPERMTQAIIAAEDENFFEHGGVDFKGLARAVYHLVSTGEKRSGGSTITMQVARNFYLTKEKTFLRKLNEIVLSYKIEHELSKQEIMALYLNKIFLGYRSYGVAAAAQTYYGKPLSDLDINEYAMIAGLPKAPSAYNPIRNAQRAKLRRDYVLRRMQELNFITTQEMQTALAVEVHSKLYGPVIEVEADYVAEEARAFALERFGEEALQNGLTIVTTLESGLQQRATAAVRDGLQDYERRHGYRGAIKNIDSGLLQDRDALLNEMQEINNYGDLLVAAVTGFNKGVPQILIENGDKAELQFADMAWAAPYINVNSKKSAPKSAADVVQVGDLIYVQKQDKRWQLAQDPLAESALISLDSNSGRVLALVGGYDYFRSKFNRATQGKRQVGSNIKPFLYSAGLEQGMTAATTINDAPVVFHDRNLEDYWRPENYSGQYYGPTRLRKALALSRNLVSIRLMQQIGINTAVDYFKNFGFPEDELNAHKNLSLSLGAVEMTPQQVARGYATFSNGGYLIEPYLIDEVRDFNGDVLYKAQPKKVCKSANCQGQNNAPRVIEERNAFIMNSIMQDVIRYGSGKRARALKREDIAGKTGTTNDQKDAWFSGFNPNITTTVWFGFDKPSTLGRSEVGGRAALPIWMDYMSYALQTQPNQPLDMPAGIVQVPINQETGLAVAADAPDALYEFFREERAPQIPKVSQQKIDNLTQELFD